MVYGSRAGSDEAPLSDSEDHDHDRHRAEGTGAAGIELSGQVTQQSLLNISSIQN